MTLYQDKFFTELVGTLKFTFEQYQLIPYDGLKHALVHGLHLVMPAPSSKHQNTVAEIFTALRTFVKKKQSGNVLSSQIDVKFSDGNGFQPDILYLRNTDLEKDIGSYIDGAPSLIIEVLSPDSEKADYGWKKIFVNNPACLNIGLWIFGIN